MPCRYSARRSHWRSPSPSGDVAHRELAEQRLQRQQRRPALGIQAHVVQQDRGHRVRQVRRPFDMLRLAVLVDQAGEPLLRLRRGTDEGQLAGRARCEAHAGRQHRDRIEAGVHRHAGQIGVLRRQRRPAAASDRRRGAPMAPDPAQALRARLHLDRCTDGGGQRVHGAPLVVAGQARAAPEPQRLVARIPGRFDEQVRERRMGLVGGVRHQRRLGRQAQHQVQFVFAAVDESTWRSSQSSSGLTQTAVETSRSVQWHSKTTRSGWMRQA